MKAINLNSLLSCLMIMGMVLPQLTQAQDKSLVKGVENFDKYSYDKAAEDLEGLDRKTTEVQRKLASSYIAMHDYPKAEEQLAAIMTRSDKQAQDVLDYAMVLKKNKKYEQSQQYMMEYLDLAPDDSRAKAHQGNSQYYQDLLKDKQQFTVKNLDVNSEQEDFGPAFYGDKIVFASSREGVNPVRRKWNWNRLPFLNIYVADKEGAQLTNPDLHFRKANKKYHDGPATFDDSAEFMVFTRNNYDATDSKGVRRLELYESRKEDGEWSAPKGLPFNNNEYSVGHATLSADGKTLYFASDKPGGQGGVDLYRSERNDTGGWTDPVNLGDRVNTEGNEMFPFIHSEGVLFFASDGLLGLGGLDVFATPLDMSGSAGMIKNLGSPVNTSRDDFALILDKEMKKGYFSSNRESGKGDDDIYSFDLLKPLAFGKRVEGIAYDKEGNILEGTEVSLKDRSGNIIETLTTGPDGYYSFPVDDDQDYTLGGEKSDFFPGVTDTDTRGDEDVVKADLELEKDPGFSLYGFITEKGSGEALDGVSVTLVNNETGDDETFETASTGDFRRPIVEKRINDRITYNLKLEKEGYLTKTVTYNKLLDRPGQYDVTESLDLALTKLEVGMDIGEAIDINPIYFDVNKSDIRPDAELELQKIVEVMNAYPEMVIELGSHTDCRASESYNMSLSDRRAKSSAAWIRKKITSSERIYGKGYGESQLVNHCACGRTDPNNTICSEEEHQANRRTEFRIVKM